MLHSIAEVCATIASGKPVLLAGSENVLAQLPRGNWIAGTIPYFMDSAGARCSESEIFVTEIPQDALSFQILDYTEAELPSICNDAPSNGFSVLIMPAGSAVHSTYAHDAAGYDGMFIKPVVGWISGVHLSRLGQDQAKVFNGNTGQVSSDRAVVMHVALPDHRRAELDIVNVFERSTGDTITFPTSGLSASDCLVNGESTNLAQYMAQVRPDPRLPLTADYNGTIVNVSVQGVDESSGTVRFYAPVFPGIEYRFAASMQDYVAAFDSAMSTRDQIPTTFACNCILNYLHSNLEGKKTGTITGPITFGEIANQLLNQTLVRLLIREA